MNDQQIPTYYETVLEETELDLIMNLVQDFRQSARQEGYPLDELVAISILDKLHATSKMPLVDSSTGLTAKGV